MGLMDIFKKKEEDSIELTEEIEEVPAKKIMIRVESLTGLIDTDRIERLLIDGNILLLKVKDLQIKDIGEFKNTVSKLKRKSFEYGWDMVAIEDGYLLLTPKFAKIVR
jgi:SepF-like predicted cell division protein (DUF552 family)